MTDKTQQIVLAAQPRRPSSANSLLSIVGPDMRGMIDDRANNRPVDEKTCLERARALAH